MNNLLKTFFYLIIFFTGSALSAQAKEAGSRNSLLWEISGNGLAQSSYLYGTVHMICGADYLISDKTKKAFGKAQKLVLEVDLADPEVLKVMAAAAIGTQPLDQLLNKHQLHALNLILKRVGMNAEQVNKYSLTTVMSLIYMKSYGCADIKMYEMEFIAQAKSQKMKIEGLETVDDQLQTITNAYSTTEMINLLQDVTPEETTKMIGLYRAEKVQDLYALLTDEKVMNAKSKNLMLDVRNNNWIQKMPAIMAQQKTFFAVGAGHLAGEQGLIKLLQKAGFQVTPVLN